MKKGTCVQKLNLWEVLFFNSHFVFVFTNEKEDTDLVVQGERFVIGWDNQKDKESSRMFEIPECCSVARVRLTVLEDAERGPEDIQDAIRLILQTSLDTGEIAEDWRN